MALREFIIGFSRWWSITEKNAIGTRSDVDTIPCGEYTTLYYVKNEKLLEIADYNKVNKKMLEAAQKDPALQEEVSFTVITKDGLEGKKFKGILLDGLSYVHNNQEERLDE